MNTEKINILLADDDKEDCLLFQEALEELKAPVKLTTVYDGEQLMEILGKKPGKFFQIIFLDLNMPRINGLACLAKIKQHKKLQHIPVVIFTTALDPHLMNRVYNDAAHYYIQKPSEFSAIKKVIRKALSLISKDKKLTPRKENFLLTPPL